MRIKYPSTVALNFPKLAVKPPLTLNDFSSFSFGIPNNLAARLSLVKVPDWTITPSVQTLDVALKYR